MSGVVDLSYVRFAVPDLDQQSRFLQDFGLVPFMADGCLYARGSGQQAFCYMAELGEPKFLGLGFQASDADQFARIAAIDGVAIADSQAPGGGQLARFTDPDGRAVDLVWGASRPVALPLPMRSPLNSAMQKSRLGERLQYQPQAQSVQRLGHCVLNVADFRESERWYKERFGLLTSDEVVVAPEEYTLGAFLRCDRGDDYTDHHTLFLVGTGTPEFNHAAFEVADWDALMLGHDQLKGAGYEHRWGVGKHLLGSQVFDYWKDPHGFTLEHFTDGDLLNAQTPPETQPIEALMGVHWGPQGSP